MTAELYAWQKECLNSWKKNKCQGIVNAITGSGKTRLALACLLHLLHSSPQKLRVKIVVPGKSLLYQWKRALEEMLPEGEKQNIGLCGSGYPSSSEKDYTICVINSARYRLARQILKELQDGCTVFLIADEYHNYKSSENRKIFEFLPYLSKLPGTYCSLGLSASPASAEDRAFLISALGKEIYHYSLSQALHAGTICDFAIWQIAVHFQPEEADEYEQLSETLLAVHLKLIKRYPFLKNCEGSFFFSQLAELAGKKEGQESKLARTYLQLSYRRKRIVHMAKARTQCVCRLLKKLDSKKQILIFGESILQIEELYTTLRHTFPFSIGRYHSKMGSTANQNALERFRTGELRILLTCRSLDEGVDVPEAAIGIILSGTSMERQRLQRLGRILRKHSGKRMACLYYLFLADSKEERAYFPKRTESFRVHNLSFHEKSGEFHFPAYEKAADLLFSDLMKQTASFSAYTEMLTCLRRGYLREDWLLPSDECRRKAEEASNTHEQNYWFCMEQMARASEASLLF